MEASGAGPEPRAISSRINLSARAMRSVAAMRCGGGAGIEGLELVQLLQSRLPQVCWFCWCSGVKWCGGDR